MNLLKRDSVSLLVSLAVVCAVGTNFLASAQPLPTSDPEICATPASVVGAEAAFLAENGAAMKKMMDGMARSRLQTTSISRAAICWSARRRSPRCRISSQRTSSG